MSSLLGTTADWYLMRASGFVALALLTITVCLGVANVARLTKSTWARSVASPMHRNASLLAVPFVAIHVLAAISDRYVEVPALAIVIPGLSHYDSLWVGLGAVCTDVLIAVVATSLIRTRLRPGCGGRSIGWRICAGRPDRPRPPVPLDRPVMRARPRPPARPLAGSRRP